ncbi:MAG: SIMPL domain-containing protein [Gammaproteobacteria bacterium]|nr:SIMPL domain-containing protein [Gammaproteobacteria bacterium]
MTTLTRSDLIIASLLVSFGLSTAGYFIGQTLYNSRVAINTADVKGLAERRVEADRAYWKVGYTVKGSDKNKIPDLYKQSEIDQQKIIALLIDSGFEATEVTPGIINYVNEEFRDDNQKLVDEKHLLIGSIEVETDKVKLVAQVRAKMNKLIAQGLDIKNNAPAYYFTKLNDIKPDMLKEATRNARTAANEFASNAGVTVGGIRSARQGGFTIRDVGEDYGDTEKIDKEVRVVTNITFYLTK